MRRKFMNKGNTFPPLTWFNYNYGPSLSCEGNQGTLPDLSEFQRCTWLRFRLKSLVSTMNFHNEQNRDQRHINLNIKGIMTL